MKHIIRYSLVLAALLAAMTIHASDFTDEEIANTESMKDVDSPPKPVKQVAPDLPSNLKGEKATVQVGFVIDAQGNVTNPRIINSTNADLDEYALASVSQWEFDPAEKGGAPCAVRVILPMRFK